MAEAPVHLFCGPDTGEKRRAVERLRAQLQRGSGGVTLAIERHYPFDTVIVDVIASLRTPSLFAPRRLVGAQSGGGSEGIRRRGTGRLLPGTCRRDHARDRDRGSARRQAPAGRGAGILPAPGILGALSRSAASLHQRILPRTRNRHRRPGGGDAQRGRRLLIGGAGERVRRAGRHASGDVRRSGHADRRGHRPVGAPQQGRDGFHPVRPPGKPRPGSRCAHPAGDHADPAGDPVAAPWRPGLTVSKDGRSAATAAAHGPPGGVAGAQGVRQAGAGQPDPRGRTLPGRGAAGDPAGTGRVRPAHPRRRRAHATRPAPASALLRRRSRWTGRMAMVSLTDARARVFVRGGPGVPWLFPH